MSEKRFFAGLALWTGLAAAWGADPPPKTIQDETTRVIEERTVIETRKVVTERTAVGQRKAAIFVLNRGGEKLNDKVPFLEDQVASRLASREFSVISRDDAVSAMKVFPTQGAAPGDKAAAGNQNYLTDRNALGTQADRLLSDNSSALRLAQNMGADFLLLVTIGSFDEDSEAFKDGDNNLDFVWTTFTLRGTYKVAEGVTGGALGGDAYNVSKRVRTTRNRQASNKGAINELLEQAATQVADSFAAKARAFGPPTPPPGRVEISIACGVKDLDGSEISLPDLRLTEDNTVVKTGAGVPAQLSATIEIDGIAMGATPAKLAVLPGLHKVKLTRPGFEPFEGTMVADKGLALHPTLQMSREGFQRWKEVRDFLNGLDTQRKLTDAQVKVLEGYAQMLRQSGYRVQAKSDVKINTTEGLKFNFHKSLY